MVWAALGRGLMGAGRVVGGAARTTGRGARMARRMFKRKGGKNSPGKPAAQQTIDVEATEVRPSTSLVPVLPSPNTSSTTPSSTTNTSEGVEDVLLRIQTNTISTEKLLKGSYAYKQKQQEENRKLLEQDKRNKKEDEIEGKEKKENKFKLPIPKQVKSFWEQLKSLFLAMFIGSFLGQIMKMRGPLSKIVRALAKVVDVIINIIGWIFNIVVTIIDAAYKLVDGMRGWVKNIFGEEGLAKFDSFLGWMNKIINAAIIAAGIITVVAGAIGAFSWAGLFGGGAAATTATTAAATSTAASTAGGLSTGATAGIVLSAGLLASGLGEGAGQLNKWGLEREKNWKQKAKDRGWWNPTKYFWAAAAGIMTILNRFFGVLGGLLDIVGAPFRMIIELIRWPFLSEEDREKQRTNLAKYDARIREQFRQGLNAIDFLGLISDDKGSWGSLYGEQGTDEMGYTRDGKTKSRQAAIKAGTILLSTPDILSTKDLLNGKPSGEKVHTILKITEDGKLGTQGEYKDSIQVLKQDAQIAAEQGDWKKYEEIQNQIDKLKTEEKELVAERDKPRGLWRGITGAADFMTLGMFDFDQRNRQGSPKDWGIRRVVGGLADVATLGLTDFDKRGQGNLQFNPIGGGEDKRWGAADEQAKRGEAQSGFGLNRAIGGFADFATLGMFDFDKQNREGAPKDYGIRRIAGGLADYMTLGLTDFDKRGAGVMQVNPIFGGKDKSWGSPYEQAKRRENQSGFGLKRGMGGFADFATFGMFDFDKQNPTGSPKGFGPFRMLAGLTDWMTMGLTDFDKRGAGNFQFDPISGGGDKRWGRERQRRQRPSTNYSYTDNYMKIAGERFIPGQALSERQYQVATMSMQMGNKYNDEVLRSYAMYEQQQRGNDVVIINRTSTVPIVSGQSGEGGLYSNDTVIIDDGTSYESYQGH